MAKKLTFDVSLNFVGKSVGVENGGELQHIKREVKISCLPVNLPDHIDVDISALDIGSSIKVRDIQAPEGITLVDVPEAAVVAVAAVRVAKSQAAEAEPGAASATEPAKEEKKD